VVGAHAFNTRNGLEPVLNQSFAIGAGHAANGNFLRR
jgi:hypothetical protein